MLFRSFLTKVYADIDFLKRKLKLSVRGICRLLPGLKGYKERYENYKPSTLRKKYEQAVELKKTDLQFNFLLSGGAALLKGSDPIAAAIELHALKI